MLDKSKGNYEARVVDSKKRIFIYMNPEQLPGVAEKITVADFFEVINKEFPKTTRDKLLFKVVQEPDQIIIYQE